MYQSVLQTKESLNKMNEAMVELGNTADDARSYKDQMGTLNKNLRSLNNVYGNVLTAMTGSAKA